MERLFGSPYVAPSPEGPATGVSSKDINISPQVSARLYLPKITDPSQKLPIVVFFHGGGFCLESAFSSAHQRYLNLMVCESKAIAVSVEYRLAPEHPLPAAYEDAWAAIEWVASHGDDARADRDQWLINFGDFNKIYIGGDSAGANIVHNTVMRASIECLYGDVKIFGAFLCQPYFWSSNYASKTQGREREKNLGNGFWTLAYPSAPGGLDNPMINPLDDDAPSLSGLGCSRLFVTVAEKDVLRDIGVLYVEAVKKSGWKGEVFLFEAEGKDHSFHIYNPAEEEVKMTQLRLLARFLNY